MMKGITNAEIREKFELIESELEELKQKVSQQTKPDPTIFLAIFTIIAIISTFMMVLDNNPIYLFFTIIGIGNMIFLIIYRLIYNKK